MVFFDCAALCSDSDGDDHFVLETQSLELCMNLAIAFICGGGMGNLIDRICQGYVVDLFDFRVFPVFNVADIFICVGCGLLLLDVLLSERKKKNDE